MPARVTAIVPTFNRAHLMAEAIHSILAQTRPVSEIIVWDDGSTDNTAEIAEQLGTIMAGAEHSDTVPAFHYFKSENGGKSRAINRALEKAQGDYIWVCDDDDLALPHALEVLTGLLDPAPEAVAACGSYRRFSVDPKTKQRLEYSPGYWPDLSQGTALRHILEDLFVFQNATLVRRSALDRVGPFREDLNRSIDYDMMVRLACAGPVKITDDPVFLQRKHDGKRGPKSSRREAKESAAVWKRNDLEVFEPFRQSIPLSMYEGMYRAEDPKHVRRAALLQRACVYARRTNWELALRDFTDAAKLAPGFQLTEVERQICVRALGGKHGSVEALAPEIRSGLREVAGMSAAGRGIARALARAMVWRGKVALRGGRFGELASVLAFIAALRLTPSPHGRGDRPGPLQENAEMPEQAYRVI